MENKQNTISDVVEDLPTTLVASETPNAVTEAVKELTQAEKDAQFKKAYMAYERLLQMKKKKHRGQNAGAFGGAGTKRKGKKKLARYLARNTVI